LSIEYRLHGLVIGVVEHVIGRHRIPDGLGRDVRLRRPIDEAAAVGAALRLGRLEPARLEPIDRNARRTLGESAQAIARREAARELCALAPAPLLGSGMVVRVTRALRIRARLPGKAAQPFRQRFIHEPAVHCPQQLRDGREAGRNRPAHRLV
jgi:hypothetical protein